MSASWLGYSRTRIACGDCVLPARTYLDLCWFVPHVDSDSKTSQAPQIQTKIQFSQRKATCELRGFQTLRLVVGECRG